MSFGDVATRGGTQGDGAGGPLADRLSLGVAARLSRYLQVLTQARKMGKETISSQELVGVHARQLDADPARPLRLRQVRQARGRLQRRLARLARSARSCGPPASTTSRCSAPATSASAIASCDIFADHGFRVVAIFDPAKEKIGEKVGSHDGPPSRRPPADRGGGGHRRRRPRRPDRRRPAARRPARGRRREDHLQLLRGAAAGAAGGHGPHVAAPPSTSSTRCTST